ncbi:MAG: hypothetical protein JNL79_19340 [Myxococcales bacterium]|nr:hypothetical protein [Myxococcales bacterium]
MRGRFLLSFGVAMWLGCSPANSTTEEPGPGTDTGGGESSTDETGTGSDTGGGGGDGATDGGDETIVFDAGDDTLPSFDTGGDGATGCTIAGCGSDSDCDGIADSVEGRFATGGPTDTDKDGTPDYLDADSDDDGIPDKLEWRATGCATGPFADDNDADGDGIPNFQDTDSDGNGYPDKNEACPPPTVLTALGMPACTEPYDFDGDGVPDYLDFDNDHDSSKVAKTIGLDDKVELADNTGKYVGLIDTDGDGIPDLYDRDSDNDGIADLDDGITDPDGDGKPSFRDTDSDGDGVGDVCEARAKASFTSADLDKPVLDTDGDGVPDYLDRDSDNDLLADGKEDVNGNCGVDAAETDRLKGDTDGDGVSDLVETALEGVPCAKDATCSPAKKGKFYFIEPYSKDGSAKPSPTSSKLALSTKLNRGDVAFIVDTTGSMGGTITGLRTSLSTTIIPALKAKIPDLGIGVAGHDDVPYGSYGYASSGDQAFYLAGGASGYVTTVTATSQTAANSLVTHYGGDGPESNVLAMYKALTGAAITWPGGSLAADSPPAGTFGAMRFRSDALPIVMNLTDINGHNGKYALDKTATSYSATYTDTYSFATYNIDDLVTQFNTIGAKFLGGAADGGSRCHTTYCPYGFLSYIADKTASYAPPSAFAGGTCQTGVSGATVAADGPIVGGVRQCRLVFSFNSAGSGLATSVVDGVSAILNSIKFDVYVQAYNDAAATVDVVGSFMSKVEPDPLGGTDPSLGTCVTFPSTQLADNFTGPKALVKAADSVNDTIKQVNPGSLYCFNVTPKENTTVVPGTDVKTFKAWLKVLAIKPTGGTLGLGADREVLFVVPPTLN